MQAILHGTVHNPGCWVVRLGGIVTQGALTRICAKMEKLPELIYRDALMRCQLSLVFRISVCHCCKFVNLTLLAEQLFFAH